ncbi:23 kDa integral membrane protein-like [Temnothorax americanus]|uniref:23 kDa integral membrane protein-like n=1 Tax=Temnothorax americanus TaxID=1964332 RepID=UPI004067A017
MGCGMGVIKYLLFIFNFIFVLCGLAILVVGVLVQVGKTSYEVSDRLEDITGNITAPAITLIVIGCIIFVIAFLGCCGAIRESHCMIVTFACLLLAILIVQVAIAIYAFVKVKNSGDINFKDVYAKDLFYKYGEGHLEETEVVDTIQNWFKCCGVDGPQDFPVTLRRPIPGSCCGKESTCDPLSAYQKGCSDVLEEMFKYSLTILGGVALGIAAAELIGIIFALCLANSIKNAQRRGYSV